MKKLSVELEDIFDRAKKFQMFQLPGQPMMMHMGTSYLVGDLSRELRKLAEANLDVKSQPDDE